MIPYSKSKEYRKEYSRSYRERIGNEKVNEWARKRYHKRMKTPADRKEGAKRSALGRARWKHCIFQMLGNRCSNPYNLEHPQWLNKEDVLQIDHVLNDGNRHTERSATYYRNIVRELWKGLGTERPRYQLLCAACNWKKEIHYRSVNILKRTTYECWKCKRELDFDSIWIIEEVDPKLYWCFDCFMVYRREKDVN